MEIENLFHRSGEGCVKNREEGEEEWLVVGIGRSSFFSEGYWSEGFEYED